MKNGRKIYNENYYRAQLIINDPKFKNLIKKLLKAFSELGCPVSKDGFKTYKEYFEWSDKYLSKRAKIEYSKSFKNKKAKITSGRISWSDKEQKQIEILENKELPPMYGENIDKLLFDLGLQRKEKYYSSLKDFIIGYAKAANPEN